MQTYNPSNELDKPIKNSRSIHQFEIDSKIKYGTF